MAVYTNYNTCSAVVFVVDVLLEYFVKEPMVAQDHVQAMDMPQAMPVYACTLMQFTRGGEFHHVR